MVAPLRPLITPWTCALCAETVAHNNSSIASERIAASAVWLNLLFFMDSVLRLGYALRSRVSMESSDCLQEKSSDEVARELPCSGKPQVAPLKGVQSRGYCSWEKLKKMVGSIAESTAGRTQSEIPYFLCREGMPNRCIIVYKVVGL